MAMEAGFGKGGCHTMVLAIGLVKVDVLMRVLHYVTRRP